MARVGTPHSLGLRLTRGVARASWLAWLLAFTGCGRPATEKDCEQIVERIAELELAAAKVEKTEAAQQVEETKEAFHARSMEQCVGKRITDNALRCVQNAKSAKEIVNDCFD